MTGCGRRVATRGIRAEAVRRYFRCYKLGSDRARAIQPLALAATMSAQALPSRVMSELKLIFTSLAIYSAVLWHLYNAPFTKVEESFNLHAIYDILTHGELVSRTNYSSWFRPDALL